MTYREFKTGVDDLGLRYKFYDYGVSVFLTNEDYLIATIYDTKQYYGVINFSPFLSDIKNQYLLYWCYDLMRTPPDKRGELE